MLIQDLTKDLKIVHSGFRSYPHVRSNASIVHVKGDTYLLTYRLFIPERKLKTNDVPIPWKSKWQNNDDTTVVCILMRKGTTFQVLHEHILYSNQTIVDTRIFKNAKDKLALSFNTWTMFPSGYMSSEIAKACVRTWDCTYVAKCDLSIKHGNFTLSEFEYPCLNLPSVLPKSSRCYEGQREEKNWAWWFTRRNEEMISYFVEPHIVFKKHKSANKCVKVAETSKNVLKKIKQIHPSLNFLLGTPPIVYNKHEYIAVGHVKYNYKKTAVLPKEMLNNKVLHFNKACNPDKPGHLVYMMYFYTFSAKYPYDIKRVGNAFVPPTSGKYLLPFPMGIANVGKTKYVVSYGEADKRVKLLTLTTGEIEAMLHDYETLTPEKYLFQVL